MTTIEIQSCAALYPAVAEAAHRSGATAVWLIGVGGAAELNLQVDRVGIRYDNGQLLGDPSSPVQLSSTLRGGRPLPPRAIPQVGARIAVDAHSDVTDAIARVPDDAVPVVMTTWALSDLPRERRLHFLQRLDAAATKRTVTWASVEGVGVAPAVPTLGDRHASGHSIIGVALFDHATLHAAAVGRCWGRGRWVSWLSEG